MNFNLDGALHNLAGNFYLSGFPDKAEIKEDQQNNRDRRNDKNTFFIHNIRVDAFYLTELCFEHQNNSKQA
jgi:hypothetical protein